MGLIKSSKFYDLNVHALPDYADSPNRMALEAKLMGYSGICLTSINPDNTFHEYSLPSFKNFEVYNGMEIQVESISKINKTVGRLRDRADIIIISGGNQDVNRGAVEDGRVDILAHPASHGKPLNHVLVKAAADNGVAIDFNIDAITIQRGGSRVKVLTAMRKNVELTRKYDAPMIITSGARSHYDLRGPREMMASAMLTGMTQVEALHALSVVPQAIIDRNLNNSRIMKGIEVVE